MKLRGLCLGLGCALALFGAFGSSSQAEQKQFGAMSMSDVPSGETLSLSLADSNGIIRPLSIYHGHTLDLYTERGVKGCSLTFKTGSETTGGIVVFEILMHAGTLTKVQAQPYGPVWRIWCDGDERLWVQDLPR
jgi:hypothetical protein